MSNVSLIFDAKNKAPVNFSWGHFCEHPEMKKYLKHIKIGDCYQLIDERTNNVIMASNKSLESYLKL